MERVEETFTKHFATGNHSKAVNILRPTRRRGTFLCIKFRVADLNIGKDTIDEIVDSYRKKLKDRLFSHKGLHFDNDKIMLVLKCFNGKSDSKRGEGQSEVLTFNIFYVIMKLSCMHINI